MNDIIPWIAAEAEDKSNTGELKVNAPAKPTRKFSSVMGPVFSVEDLPAHQFPAKGVDAVAEAPVAEIQTADANTVTELSAELSTQFPTPAMLENAAEDYFEDPLDRDPDLWLYRKRTITLLRKYLRYSLETGRLPSILGSEFFRSQVTSYSVTTFEDRVVFVHDVEVCLQRLDSFAQKIIGCVILQEHNYDAAAKRLHCSRRTLERGLFTALDELSEQFLAVGMLVRAATRTDLYHANEFDDEEIL